MAALIVTQREHSAMGELVASWAFASAAFPIAMLGGASRIHAGLFTLTLVGIQTVGTVTVRAFLESQGKKDRSVLRLFPLLLGLLIMGLGFAGSQSSAKHVALAMIPSTLVAAWMLLAPPSARRMKHIGWALTLASVAGAALLLFLWA
jgi:hypothetical protein